MYAHIIIIIIALIASDIDNNSDVCCCTCLERAEVTVQFDSGIKSPATGGTELIIISIDIRQDIRIVHGVVFSVLQQ